MVRGSGAAGAAASKNVVKKIALGACAADAKLSSVTFAVVPPRVRKSWGGSGTAVLVTGWLCRGDDAWAKARSFCLQVEVDQAFGVDHCAKMLMLAWKKDVPGLVVPGFAVLGQHPGPP